jgi:hypothetical protein
MEKAEGSMLVVAVAGRRFHVTGETTFEQDIYIMQLLEETGLQSLAQNFDITKDDVGAISSKVIITAYASGKLFLLLAAVMEEVGTVWSKEQAVANGEFFSKLKRSEDKEALKGSIVSVILSFFVSGLLSSNNSQRLSAVRLEMLRENTEPQSEPSSLDEEPTNSEPGQLSSVS